MAAGSPKGHREAGEWIFSGLLHYSKVSKPSQMATSPAKSEPVYNFLVRKGIVKVFKLLLFRYLQLCLIILLTPTPVEFSIGSHIAALVPAFTLALYYGSI